MSEVPGNMIDCATEQAGGYPQVLHIRAHTLRADVGQDSGSTDSAPGPHDYFDAALAACPIHKLMTATKIDIETLA